MSDDVLRAFERALATGDLAAMRDLAPFLLARARSAPDLTAPERERVALEERKRIGERMLGLQSLGFTTAGEVWAWAGREDVALGALLLRGELPPDPHDIWIRVTLDGAPMLQCPLTTIPRGLAGITRYLESHGVETGLVRCEVLIRDRVVWSRDPEAPSFFAVPAGPNVVSAASADREPLYDRVTMPGGMTAGRPRVCWAEVELRGERWPCVRPSGHDGPHRCSQEMG